MKPAFSTTAHASSSVTDFMRSRIASGTFGRPSGNLSPVQSGVYLITSSRVKNPCCARALRDTPRIIEVQTTPTDARLSCRTKKSNCSTAPILCLCIRLEPGCSWNFYCLGHLFVHLYAQARLIQGSHISFLNNLALLNKCLPNLQMIDPVPLADQVVGNSRAHMGRGHGADGRDDAVWCKGNVVGLGHVGDLACLREPAYLLNIRHDDICRALLQQFGVAPTHV